MRIPLLILSLLVLSEINAQSVSINTTGATANSSSILDVSSTAKGVLFPRMTKAQKNAIATPATGLLVYQAGPDSVGFHYYSGSQWFWLPSNGGDDWKLTGNAGTDSAVHFLGTTDTEPLMFRVNNIRSGRIEAASNVNSFLGAYSGSSTTTGFRNTAFGYRSMFANTTGRDNVAIGANAMENAAGITSNENIAIGSRSLMNSNSFYNIGIGTSALQQSTGQANVALGIQALFTNTTGQANIAIGYYTLRDNTTGYRNIGIGLHALSNNTTGNYNIAIGDSAAYNNNASRNIAIGNWAMFANTTGTINLAIGDSALYDNTSGYKNLVIGNNALINNTTGFQNLAIGHNTLKSNVTGFANIAIGDSALSANTTNWNIAIGRVALLKTTTGDKNVAIGESALTNNVTGTNNVAIGYGSQLAANTNNKNNTSLGFRSAFNMQGYSNVVIGADAMGKSAVSYSVNNTVAVGDSVLFNIATGANYNTGLGSKTLYNNTSGWSNTAIGVRAMYGNTTGTNNVAVGDSALYNSTGSYGQVAIGSKALFGNTTGGVNTAVGSFSLESNTTGNQNNAFGYQALNANTTGSYNVAMGVNALLSSTTASGNTALGAGAMFSNTTGSENVALGRFSLFDNTTGSDNVAIGDEALQNNVSGHENIAMGDSAAFNTNATGNMGLGIRSLFSNVSGTTNTMIGYEAGYAALGSGNVMLGFQAGRAETGSNKLYIDNSNTTMPLLYGDFTSNLLRINGTLNINNDYSFPVADGTANQVLRTNGAGAVSWATVAGESTTASNGLTLTGNNITLGGSLTAATTVSQGNFNMTQNLNGTGDYFIQTASSNAFSVLSDGKVGFNIAAPAYNMHVVNTTAGGGNKNSGIMIQNTNVGIGAATINFKNTSLPTAYAWYTGMNNGDNYVVAYGDSLRPSNVIFRVDTSGNAAFNPSGSPNSRLEVNGDFSMRLNAITLPNGPSDNVDPGRYSFIKINGPTLAFSISGFTGGVDGKILTVLNLTGTNMTIVNQTTSGSAAANRINTLTGGDIVTTGNGSVTLQYSGADNRWMVIAVRD